MMRNNSLDAFRLFTAFAVILLHVGYGSLPPVAEDNIRLLGRFAVPFFFMISGYFFFLNYQKNGDKAFINTLKKLLGISIVASFIYLFIKLERVSFSFSLLYQGTSYHLWFLSSLIFGLIICWYHYSYLSSRYLMIALSIAIVILALISDAYSGLFSYKPDKEFCRYLLCIPYMYFGTVIAQKQYKLSIAVSILLIATGISLQIFESRYLTGQYPYNEFHPQMLIGTIPFSLGIFFLSFSCGNLDFLGELGRKYSLSIYVYHLFVNFFLFKVIKFAFKGYADYVFIFSAVISFAFTLAFLMIVQKYLPRIFSVMNGDLTVLFKRRRIVTKDKISKDANSRDIVLHQLANEST